MITSGTYLILNYAGVDTISTFRTRKEGGRRYGTNKHIIARGIIGMRKLNNT